MSTGSEDYAADAKPMERLTFHLGAVPLVWAPQVPIAFRVIHSYAYFEEHRDRFFALLNMPGAE